MSYDEATNPSNGWRAPEVIQGNREVRRDSHVTFLVECIICDAPFGWSRVEGLEVTCTKCAEEQKRGSLLMSVECRVHRHVKLTAFPRSFRAETKARGWHQSEDGSWVCCECREDERKAGIGGAE